MLLLRLYIYVTQPTSEIKEIAMTFNALGKK
jgi:hypothetical protein